MPAPAKLARERGVERKLRGRKQRPCHIDFHGNSFIVVTNYTGEIANLLRIPTNRMPPRNSRLLPRLRRWRRRAGWARRKFASAPRIVRIAASAAMLLVVVTLVNLVYHVILKPTELFAFVGHRLDKEPAETWRQYGPLFRTYSTSTIAPELLAALAQVESSGNPVD